AGPGRWLGDVHDPRCDRLHRERDRHVYGRERHAQGLARQGLRGDDNPKEFKYALTFNDDAVGTCTDHKNTASAKGEDTGDVASSDEVTVQDCQGSDLTVKKDATPSFKRTYKWDISKKADTAKVYSAGGGESGPANYTVSV